MRVHIAFYEIMGNEICYNENHGDTAMTMTFNHAEMNTDLVKESSVAAVKVHPLSIGLAKQH